ncbi:hypothetical protein ACWEF6_06685 [Amycolatopsis sp. NPDC004772]
MQRSKKPKPRHRIQPREPKRPAAAPAGESVVHPLPGFRDPAGLPELCRSLISAVHLLRTGHDAALLRAFLEGRRVAFGLLTPWWRRLFQPSRATYLRALPPALAALDRELKRRRAVDEHWRAVDLPWGDAPAGPDPVPSPCLIADRCENCSSRTGRLHVIVEDCAIGVPTGLRPACAVLCRDCRALPFGQMFGPAEISRRVMRHRTH